MTARDLYEYVLIELHKENAPNILLEDFNYFVNKAINQYVNKRYNIYDINQQTTDDLRVLKATAFVPITSSSQTPDDLGDEYTNNSDETSHEIPAKFLKATKRVKLPDDYLHMLNCICSFKLEKPWRCYDQGDYFEYPATKLTADMWGQVVNNYWNKPTYRRPYYYIHTYNDSQANLISNDSSQDTTDNNITVHVPTKDSNKQAEKRYGNQSKVYCEIRYGTDSETFNLVGVYIDYIKAPQFVRLTQKQIDKVQDESQILEFPDYVCQEIVNELVHIIMENISDQRIQTHPVVSQSIANPAQQQTEPVAQQS